MKTYEVIVAAGMHRKAFGDDLEGAIKHAKRCVFVTGTDVVITKTEDGKPSDEHMVVQVDGTIKVVKD